MKTLPSIPKSIPSHIRAEAKSKGLVYVGKGRLRSQGCLFPDGEVSFRYRKSDEDDLLERDTWNGTTPTADYFASPEVAAKYFILPKKTTQVLTRGAKGRFVSPKPAPVVKYPDVKSVEPRPLGLAHSIEHCDKVLNGDMEALFYAFTWASAAPAGKNFQYWYEPNRGVRPLLASDLDYVRAIRDEFKARLALEEKAKTEAAAKAHREEEERKSRLPKIGEVWHAAFTNEDYLVSQVSFSDALLISLANGNRLDDVGTKYDHGTLVAFPSNYGPFTFVAASPAEYFKNNP